MLRWFIPVLAWLGLIEKPRFIARYSESHPKLSELSDTDLVIVRSGSFTKWACFRCPCGCGDKIALSLATDRRPSWKVVLDRLRRPTVTPSVWQKAGCYSHFWIKKGAVDWCLGTGRPSIGADLSL
jgi:Family of unknown function (DUF6527)